MDKQTTLAFVLIGILLVVWLYINSPEPTENVPQQVDTVKVTEDETPESPLKEVPKASTPLQQQAAQEDTSDIFQTPTQEEQIITIDTDLARIELTNKGGRIRKYYLKEHKTWYHRQVDSTDFYNTHVQLVNNSEDGGDLNLVFVTKQGKLVNTADVDFTSSLEGYQYTVKGSDSLTIAYTFEIEEGKSLTKYFTFFGNDYAADIDVEFDNMHDVISNLQYDIVWGHGINFVEKNSVDEANYSQASAYSGDEQVEFNADDPDEGTITKEINGRVDWVAVKNKYFAIILSPDNPTNDGGAFFQGTQIKNPDIGIREFYSTSLKMPFEERDYQKDSYELYLGPVDYGILQEHGRNFEKVFDFGGAMGLGIVIRPISEYILLPLFKFLHTFISNWGLVIIVFSIIIKIVLYPLTKQSYKSMRRMQLLQPKISELKEKYKDDPQKQQKETMKLYQTYGVNPAGGCLPMLLQMPILFALWSLLNVAIDIRQEPFMLWIDNLSAPDIIYHLPFTIPLAGIDFITGLAPVLGITMFMQQKMTVKDPSQKAMVYVMPIMFTVLFMGFPSGLNLYYLMFNLLSIIQQYAINKPKAGEAELKPVPANKKKKSGWMQRMMEAAEKQQQAQKDYKKQEKKKRKF